MNFFYFDSNTKIKTECPNEREGRSTYMVWYYDIVLQTLNFIGNRKIFPAFSGVIFSRLMKKVQSGFISNYDKLVGLWFETGGCFDKMVKSNLFLKISFKKDKAKDLIVIKQVIIPNIIEGEAVALNIVNFSVKCFKGEPFITEIKNISGNYVMLVNWLKVLLGSKFNLSDCQRGIAIGVHRIC